MPEISRFERVTDNIFQRMDKLRNEKGRAEIPIGFEKVRKDVAVGRFQKMTPEAKKKLIEKVGIDEVMRMIGG